MDALLKKFCRWHRYRAWSDGTLWLSLDRFERFWPDARLTLVNGAAVKSAVRAALRTKYAMDAAHRARRALNPDAPADKEYLNRIHTLPKGCLTNIAETAGMEDAECIARWILGPVHRFVKSFYSWKRWSALMYHLSKEDPDKLASQYKLSLEKARKIVEIYAHFRRSADAIKERMQAADREPLTDWDAVAYADYRRETPEASPLVGARECLFSQDADRAFEEVQASTDQADSEAIVKWANDFSRTHDRQIPDFEDIIPTNLRGPW